MGKLPYRKDIDGIRAIAIIPVVLYHIGLPGFSGGFVGVDVFFVISGFLITRLVDSEMSRHAFSIVEFYERRARRILPALFSVVALTLLVGALVLYPRQLAELGESALATVGFGSNIYFWQSSGYFAQAAEYKPLLHTWSVALEEQFYLLFPPAFLLVRRLGRTTTLVAVSAVVAASFGASVLLSAGSSGGAFFLIPTRAWELGVGVILALCGFKEQARWRREFEGAVGFALIAYAVVAFDGGTVFPGANAAIPCLGTALLIRSGQGGTLISAHILQRSAMRRIGLISYSLYLWHWPILAILRAGGGTAHLTVLELVLAAMFSVVLAELSYRFIEIPARSRDWGTRRAVFGASALGAVLTGAAAYLLWSSGGWEQRFSPAELAAVGQGREDIEEMNERYACLDAPPEGLCWMKLAEAAEGTLLWGDSQAAAAYGAFLQVDSSVVLAAKNGCAPLVGIDQAYSDECRPYAESIIDFLTRDSVGIGRVVLHANWTRYANTGRLLYPGPGTGVEGLDFRNQSERAMYHGLESTVKRLKQKGMKVVILGNVPGSGVDIGWAAIRQQRRGVPIASSRTKQEATAIHSRSDRVLTSIAGKYPVEYHDLIAQMCPDVCIVQMDGLPLYRDELHLSPAGARLLLAPAVSVILSSSADPKSASSEVLPLGQ